MTKKRYKMPCTAAKRLADGLMGMNIFGKRAGKLGN